MKDISLYLQVLAGVQDVYFRQSRKADNGSHEAHIKACEAFHRIRYLQEFIPTINRARRLP